MQHQQPTPGWQDRTITTTNAAERSCRSGLSSIRSLKSTITSWPAALWIIRPPLVSSSCLAEPHPPLRLQLQPSWMSWCSPTRERILVGVLEIWATTPAMIPSGKHSRMSLGKLISSLSSRANKRCTWVGEDDATEFIFVKISISSSGCNVCHESRIFSSLEMMLINNALDDSITWCSPQFIMGCNVTLLCFLLFI